MPKLAALLVTCLAVSGQSSQVYIWGFQQGSIAAVNVVTGGVVATFPVRDRSGIASPAIAPDGKTLFVLDDEGLKIFDTVSHELIFQRALTSIPHQLGGGPYIHATRDGRSLLVKTHDLEGSADGVRIFDTKARMFAGVGLRARACPAPLFASANEFVFAVCPGLIQALRRQGDVPDFREMSRMEMPTMEVSDVAVTAGGQVCIVEMYRGREKEWRLFRWSPGEAKPVMTDLHKTLLRGKETAPAKDLTRAVHLAASPAGTAIAIAHDSRVWLLDAAGSSDPVSFEVPGSGQGIGYSSDGKMLMTLTADPVQLIQIGGGAVRPVPIKGLSPSRGPLHLLTVP